MAPGAAEMAITAAGIQAWALESLWEKLRVFIRVTEAINTPTTKTWIAAVYVDRHQRHQPAAREKRELGRQKTGCGGRRPGAGARRSCPLDTARITAAPPSTALVSGTHTPATTGQLAPLRWRDWAVLHGELLSNPTRESRTRRVHGG